MAAVTPVKFASEVMDSAHQFGLLRVDARVFLNKFKPNYGSSFSIFPAAVFTILPRATAQATHASGSLNPVHRT
jgi:hypothetical protein